MSHVFDTDELIGTQVGRYRIDARIARGGMGVLYRAEHTGLARIAALKVIAPELASNKDYRMRFEREARSAAAIEHPNVVPVWDYAEDRGMLYIAMRFVDGPDLGEVIHREGRLAPQRAAALIAQAGAALDAAHARGLVHRDVKPGNMLIERRGGIEHVWVTDFGLARASARSRTDLTRHGAILGTLDFIAPEQLDDSPVDGRADVYALGCVLYYALCGRVPYPRKNDAQRMMAHASEPPPVLPIPELQAFNAVIARAMAKRPQDRFQHAGHLGAAAMEVARRAPAPRPQTPPVSQHQQPPRTPTPRPHTPAPPPRIPTPSPHTPPPPRRSRPGWLLPVGAALAALIVGVGILAATGTFGGGASPGPPRPEATNVPGTRGVTEDEASTMMGEFESLFKQKDSEGMVALMTPDAHWRVQGLWDASTPQEIKDEFDSAFESWTDPYVAWTKVSFTPASGETPATMRANLAMSDGPEFDHPWFVQAEFVRLNGKPLIAALADVDG